MKRIFLSLLVAPIIALPVFAADDHAPKHGGVVVETKAGDLELVAKADMMLIHVSDHCKRKIDESHAPPLDRSRARPRLAGAGRR
jgi:hypothetical protein